MADDRIGRLFPSGGPVPPDLVVGRNREIDEVARRLREAIHTLLTGERRIGKTTVCDAACDRLRQDGAVIVKIEVPESTDAVAMLQLVVDRCSRISLAAAGRRLFRAAKPLIEEVLRDEGVPLDLSEFGRDPGQLPTRSILALPRTLAKQTNQPVVFFLDELQRAVDYTGHEHMLGELVDLYSGATDVGILIDGSEERALDGLIGPPVQMGKLCDRLALDPRIPTYTWREALPNRFEEAALAIEPEALEALVAFGGGRPYDTMTAARYAALNARKLGSNTVGAFEAEEGIAEARRHLEEDA